MATEKEETNALQDSVFLGADEVHPEDLEPDTPLFGEEGYEAPDAEAPETGGEPAPESEAEAVSEDEQGAAKEKAEEPEQVEAEAAAEEEPEEVVTQRTIPKARLDKALRDKRAAENRIRELEEQLQTGQPQQTKTQPEPAQQAPAEQDPAEVQALEQAFLEGDMAKFSELMARRDQRIQEAATRTVLESVQKQVPEQLTQNQVQQKFDKTRIELETQYAFLDPTNTEGFDQELVDTISDFTNSFVRRGYTPADALQEAAERVLKVEKPELFIETPKTTAKAQQVKTERLDIDQKMKLARQQPPEVQATEAEVDSLPDFENMSEADFDKYSDAELDKILAKSRKGRL